VGNPERARAEFRRVCIEHLDAATHEDTDEKHVTFLRREVLETFLPRYARLANRQNDLEDRGFGFGVAAEPVGRALALAGALFALFFMLRLLANPMAWPLVAMVASFPFWPDVAAYMYRSQFTSKLEQLVADMERIDEQTKRPLHNPDGTK
jgi:hypothetical protein